MSNFSSRVKNKVVKASGSTFWVKKTITSSALTTTAQDLTSTATGQLFIKEVIVKTDATGLAGATNLEILTNNAKGVVNVFVEAVSNLGASVTKVMSAGAIQAETTTSDAHPTITALPTVLEAGKKMQFIGTSSAGTGAGTIDVFVCFERIDENAVCSAA